MTALPVAGDDAVLAVSDREALMARVLTSSRHHLDLDLLQAPRTPRAQIERLPLAIEFLNAEGYARLHGRGVAVSAAVAAECAGLGFAHRGQAQLLQRRERLRAPATRSLRAERAGAGDPSAVLACTVEVGGWGMTVRGLPSPRVGEEFRFTLDLSDGTRVVGRFAVERHDRDTASVRFTALTRGDRSRLMALAVEALRQRRRMA